MKGHFFVFERKKIQSYPSWFAKLEECLKQWTDYFFLKILLFFKNASTLFENYFIFLLLLLWSRTFTLKTIIFESIFPKNIFYPAMYFSSGKYIFLSQFFCKMTFFKNTHLFFVRNNFFLNIFFSKYFFHIFVKTFF